jgi:hypothetical protein
MIEAANAARDGVLQIRSSCKAFWGVLEYHLQALSKE